MTAEELIRELRFRGVELTVEGDRVRYRPKQAVPAALQPILLRHKYELLALLSSTDPEVAWRADRMRSQVPVTDRSPSWSPAQHQWGSASACHVAAPWAKAISSAVDRALGQRRSCCTRCEKEPPHEWRKAVTEGDQRARMRSLKPSP